MPPDIGYADEERNSKEWRREGLFTDIGGKSLRVWLLLWDDEVNKKLEGALTLNLKSRGS